MSAAAQKEGEEKGVDLDALHHRTHKQINYVASKAKINQQEVYTTVKSFFRELLELNYEFTHEELIEELHKIYLDKKTHDELVAFLEHLGKMEYTKKEYSQEELESILEEMRHILNHLIHHHKKKLSLKDKLLVKLHLKKITTEKIDAKEKPLIELEEEIKKEEEDVKEEEELITMQKLLKKVASETDVKKAKVAYKKASESYSKLKPEEQKVMYDELMNAYKKLSGKNN